MKYCKILSVSVMSVLLMCTNVFGGYPLDVVKWSDDGVLSTYNVVSTHSGLKGVANKKGIVIVDTIYKDVKVLENWNKFAVQNNDGKWYVIDAHGNIYTDKIYDYVDTKYIDKGYVELGINGDREYNGKVGIMNEKMELVAPVEYQTYIFTQKDGILVGKLTKDGKFDYYKINEENSLEKLVTLNGVLCESPKADTYYIKKYKDCKEYNKDTEKYTNSYIELLGLCDNDYNIIIEPLYEVKSFAFYDDFAVVKTGSTEYVNTQSGKVGNGKYGIIDKKGNVIVKCIYDSITRTINKYTLNLDGERETIELNTDLM